LLICRAAARDLLVAMAAIEAPPQPTVTRAQLWEHACRPAGLVSLAVERAIRQQEDVRREYCRLVAQRALHVSERAMAAYGGAPFRRKVGSAIVEIVEEEGLPAALVITLEPGKQQVPRSVEVVALEGIIRHDLPKAISGHIIMDLPREDADLDQLRILLANPEAALYLLP
jgi:hypothetical protein